FHSGALDALLCHCHFHSGARAYKSKKNAGSTFKSAARVPILIKEYHNYGSRRIINKQKLKNRFKIQLVFFFFKFNNRCYIFPSFFAIVYTGLLNTLSKVPGSSSIYGVKPRLKR